MLLDFIIPWTIGSKFSLVKLIISLILSLNSEIIFRARKIISEFKDNIREIINFTRENLEPIVQGIIKSNNTNFKGVGQPLRVALTGSKFGPGIYDIIISLGKEEVEKRLSNKTIS